MKVFLTSLILLTGQLMLAQNTLEDNLKWRKELNKEFRDSATSPLSSEDLARFDSLSFFPIREKYLVKATLELTPESKPFKMKTTTDRLADYRQYGIAHFTLEGKEFQLPVYQNLRLLQMPKYKKYLFVPFTDLTNGEQTYAGGRYVETEIPEGDTLLIDFNKAYNPYCVYNYKYSCPIPPKENHLEIKIEAGVLDYHKEEPKQEEAEKPGESSPMR